MQLFYTGLCIVKSLLKLHPTESFNLIMQYEEACLEDNCLNGEIQHNGFIEQINQVLIESM